MRRISFGLALAASGIFATAYAQNVIGTFAGTYFLFPARPLPAVSAPLGHVQGVTLDTTGQLYVSDLDNNIVVRVASNGILTVYAGNGLGGFSGDGGRADSASLNQPAGLAVDSSGYVYIADSGNQRVRRVAPDGTITTFAGTGTAGFGADGGLAAASRLDGPRGLALDAGGNLYIADSANHRVRKVTPAGLISTFAGNGQAGSSGDGGPAILAQLNTPADVTVDRSGNVYIATVGGVRKVAPDGSISTVTGFVSAGLATDSQNNLYISDAFSNSIHRLAPDGTLTTAAGTGAAAFSGDGGPAKAAALSNPRGLTVSLSGVVHVADRNNLRVREIDSAGIIQTKAGNGAFQFSGDGQQGTSANLSQPVGVATGGLGDIFVADLINNRIRKVTPDGIINTVAGNGAVGYSGDHGPAGAATLAGPEGVAVDASGFYIADRSNNVVRKVDLQNIISTIAGGGTPAVGVGDSGPASKAVLRFPFALAEDAAGNLYIADTNDDRIRMVTPDLNIMTVAGGGTSSAEGVLATDAKLNAPQGVAVDGQGRIYVADTDNNRIRVVANARISTIAGGGSATGENVSAVSASVNSPRGLILDGAGNLYYAEYNANRVREVSGGRVSTVAGVGGPGAFSGDGRLAVNASLNGPVGLAFDGAGNLYIADSGNNRIRRVLAAPPSYQFTPSSLSVSAAAGGVPPAPQTVSLTSSIPGLAFTASSDSNWLTLNLAVGSLPASLQVNLDPNALAVGSHQGEITITVPNAAPSTATIPVTFNIQPATGPQLNVDTKSLNFGATQGGGPQTLQMRVANSGTDSLSFAVSVTTVSGGSWLSVTPGSGTATPSSPAALNVTANIGSLPPGTYLGTITITGGGSTIPVPVTLSAAAPSAAIQLSQNGLSFRTLAQGGSPLPQTLGILNTGQGSMDWSATATTLSGGGWLSISPSSDTVNRPFLDVSSVGVSVNPAGLVPGDYYGIITVNASAVNAPQSAIVILTVLPAGANLGPEVQPSSLTFTSTAGITPGSQDVMIGNPKSQPDSYVSQTTGMSFTFLPASAQVQPNQPSTLRVYPDFSNLQGGTVQRGTITLQFFDGTLRNINVLTVTAPAASASLTANGIGREAGCAPTSLLVQPIAPTDNSSATLLQPVTLQVHVVDSCGAPVNSSAGAAVAATFSNRDTLVNLVPIGGGTWSATWTPRNSSASSVIVQVSAFMVRGLDTAAGVAKVSVSLLSGSPTPVTFGAANAASGLGTYISPGGLVSVYGQQLADMSATSSNVPFPTQVNGTQVLMGGRPLPLRYVGNGQVNAQVPFDLGINTVQQLIVRHGTALSVPQDVVVAAAQPAVYTQDQSGTGAGVIVNGRSNALVTPDNPAHIGDVVVIYCNGLGAVNPPVPTGTPAPLGGPPSSTVNLLNVTIGGVTAQVNFSGLTPGYPDLYQVNAVVPAGVTPGDEVPVVLTIAGQTSPPVTMAVQ